MNGGGDNSSFCAKCGTQLSARALLGLCPRCLAASIVEENDDADLADRESASAAPLIKRVGQYELLEMLGRGGMGTVYRARHVALNRTVALKLLSQGQEAGHEGVSRFLAEARAAAQLDHPNIISIFDVGEDDGNFYIAMELIEGGSLGPNLPGLSATSSGRAKPSQTEIAGLVAKIARAVHHAHQRGILHRDLKPGNILMTTSGEPIVADFGIARLTGETARLTQTGRLLGSPAYMAPEAAAGNHPEATTASDTYGLGAILYELLTGHPPFDGGTPLEVLKKVTEEEPLPLMASRSGIDHDLEIICLKCLNKEPAGRYISAKDLAEDLERWGRHEPIRARATSPTEKLVKWIRRKPVTAGLLLALALTLLGGLAAVLVEWRKALKSDLTAQRNLYAEDMSHAFRALQDNNSGRVQELLRLHDGSKGPDLRDWEWDYLSGQCTSMELSTVAQMPGRVFDLAFSQDASRFAAVASDGMVALFDARTKAKLFEGHHAQPTVSVAFAKDASFMITASLEWGLKKWAIPSGASELLSSPVGNLFQVRSSPDENIFALAGQYGVALTSLENKGQPARISDRQMRRLAWRADGKLLAGGAHQGTLHLWDIESRRQVAEWQAHRPISPVSATVAGLDISADGRWLVSSGADEKMFRWDLQAENARTELTNFSGSIQALAFSPDGKFLAGGGSDQRIQVWDTKTWEVLWAAAGHRSEISSLAWFPDGERILSGGVDGSIKIWSKQNSKVDRERVIFPVPPDTLWGSPDNSTVFTKDPRGLWDSVSLTKLPLHSGPPGMGVTMPAGKGELVTAVNEGKLFLWQADTGRIIDTLQCSRNIFWLGLSKDCSRLAGLCQATNGMFVEAWDLKNRKKLLLAPAGQGFPPVLAWSNDGRSLAAGLLNGMVRLWDVPSARELANFHAHNDVLLGGCFSTTGHLFATSGMDGIVKIWEIPGLKLHLPPFKVSKSSVMALAFSENDRRLATGDGDGTVRIWDAETGQETGVLPPHQGYIRIIGFLPDQTLMSVSPDQISLWPIKRRVSSK
jgi:WD40 repeat protein/serine/threonine protein kinase